MKAVKVHGGDEVFARISFNDGLFIDMKLGFVSRFGKPEADMFLVGLSTIFLPDPSSSASQPFGVGLIPPPEDDDDDDDEIIDSNSGDMIVAADPEKFLVSIPLRKAFLRPKDDLNELLF